jgi:hypothetical protein
MLPYFNQNQNGHHSNWNQIKRPNRQPFFITLSSNLQLGAHEELIDVECIVPWMKMSKPNMETHVILATIMGAHP